MNVDSIHEIDPIITIARVTERALQLSGPEDITQGSLIG